METQTNGKLCTCPNGEMENCANTLENRTKFPHIINHTVTVILTKTHVWVYIQKD